MSSYYTASADARGARFCDSAPAMSLSAFSIAVRAAQITAGATANDAVRQP
jgi:hypothetical protein